MDAAMIDMKFRNHGAAALMCFAMALAGCETVSRGSGPSVAEVEDDKATAAVNRSLTEVIERNPSDASAYNTRGAAYARSGRYQDAIADFSKAIQINPGYAAAYANRALAYRQTGRNDAAMADFTRAIEADPNYGPAYLGRGIQPGARPLRRGLCGLVAGDPAQPGISATLSCARPH
jgi:tetratricopeptide (TPR) repeat protein